MEEEEEDKEDKFSGKQQWHLCDAVDFLFSLKQSQNTLIIVALKKKKIKLN
jgi:hypothetical protein